MLNCNMIGAMTAEVSDPRVSPGRRSGAVKGSQPQCVKNPAQELRPGLDVEINRNVGGWQAGWKVLKIDTSANIVILRRPETRTRMNLGFASIRRKVRLADSTASKRTQTVNDLPPTTPARTRPAKRKPPASAAPVMRSQLSATPPRPLPSSPPVSPMQRLLSPRIGSRRNRQPRSPPTPPRGRDPWSPSQVVLQAPERGFSESFASESGERKNPESPVTRSRSDSLRGFETPQRSTPASPMQSPYAGRNRGQVNLPLQPFSAPRPSNRRRAAPFNLDAEEETTEDLAEGRRRAAFDSRAEPRLQPLEGPPPLDEEQLEANRAIQDAPISFKLGFTPRLNSPTTDALERDLKAEISDYFVIDQCRIILKIDGDSCGDFTWVDMAFKGPFPDNGYAMWRRSLRCRMDKDMERRRGAVLLPSLTWSHFVREKATNDHYLAVQKELTKKGWSVKSCWKALTSRGIPGCNVSTPVAELVKRCDAFLRAELKERNPEESDETPDSVPEIFSCPECSFKGRMLHFARHNAERWADEKFTVTDDSNYEVDVMKLHMHQLRRILERHRMTRGTSMMRKPTLQDLLKGLTIRNSLRADRDHNEIVTWYFGRAKARDIANPAQRVAYIMYNHCLRQDYYLDIDILLSSIYLDRSFPEHLRYFLKEGDRREAQHRDLYKVSLGEPVCLPSYLARMAWPRPIRRRIHRRQGAGAFRMPYRAADDSLALDEDNESDSEDNKDNEDINAYGSDAVSADRESDDESKAKDSPPRRTRSPSARLWAQSECDNSNSRKRTREEAFTSVDGSGDGASGDGDELAVEQRETQRIKFEEELKEREERAQKCQLCIKNRRDTCFFPCGHFYYCSECAVRLRQCPACRRPIRRKQKVFF